MIKIRTDTNFEEIVNDPMKIAEKLEVEAEFETAKFGPLRRLCGINNRQMRVVGGYETKAHEFPWMAGLTKNGKFQCGASLISKKHILTAAHCVYGFNIQELSVVLADHNRAAPNRLSDIVVRGLRSIKQHEKFDNYTFNNDIAILELDQPVDFTPMVQPACLPQKDIDYSGRNGVVTGWGWTSENDETSDVLRKVTVPIWTKKECGNSHYGEKKISDNMFCAGFSDGKHDACRGDSGDLYICIA
ncbi:hypothetical protein WA026_009243 [Henosepilachna vigintioctopunctata]|uniref:Peptidase S1 domain-containing protein n=1 Tax=Henosepilachna vigintioctopunctata TaxID=420089 RepID=A0AAW1UYT5_9CUCU